MKRRHEKRLIKLANEMMIADMAENMAVQLRYIRHYIVDYLPPYNLKKAEHLDKMTTQKAVHERYLKVAGLVHAYGKWMKKNGFKQRKLYGRHDTPYDILKKGNVGDAIDLMMLIEDLLTAIDSMLCSRKKKFVKNI